MNRTTTNNSISRESEFPPTIAVSSQQSKFPPTEESGLETPPTEDNLFFY